MKKQQRSFGRALIVIFGTMVWAASVTLASASAPSVQTTTATGVSSSGATLNATITSTGGAGIVDARFEYTSSSFPGTVIYKVPVSGNTFSYSLAGLQPSTTYTYHAYAKNSAGLWNAVVNNRTFTTKASQGGTVAGGSGAFTLTRATPDCNGSSPHITLNWTASSGVVTYDVYRNGKLYSPGVPAGTLSFDNTSVTPGTTYTYFIRAKNATGNRDSGSLSATAPSNCGGTPPKTGSQKPTGNNVAGTAPAVNNSTSGKPSDGPNLSAFPSTGTTPKPKLEKPPTNYQQTSPAPNLTPPANNNTALTRPTTATGSEPGEWFKTSELGKASIGILSHVSTKHNFPLTLESYPDPKFGGLRIGQYRITPGTSIDLKGVAGTLRALEKAEQVKTLYSIYDYSKSEFESRGITGSKLINAWAAGPQSVVFALENPDAGIKALIEGFTSASAVSIRFASFGLVEFHGPDVERYITEMPERVKQLQEKQKRESAEYQAKQKAYWDAVKNDQEQLNKKIQAAYDSAVDTIGLKTSPESSPSPPPQSPSSPPPVQKNYQPPAQSSKQPSTSNFNPTPAPINSGQGSFVVLKTGGQTTPALAAPPSYTSPPVQKASKP